MFLAEATVSGKPTRVAVKMLRMTATRSDKEEFLAEAQVMLEMNSDYLVKVGIQLPRDGSLFGYAVTVNNKLDVNVGHFVVVGGSLYAMSVSCVRLAELSVFMFFYPVYTGSWCLRDSQTMAVGG